jgi:hypothetical protein
MTSSGKVTPDRGAVDSGVFQFTIRVALKGEHDPRRAVRWMVDHMLTGLQVGQLPIRGVAPDGTVYLWFPERGKTPDDWLVTTSPPSAEL